jgi:hypothetical protein
MSEDIMFLVVGLLSFLLGFLVRGELSRLKKRREEAD